MSPRLPRGHTLSATERIRSSVGSLLSGDDRLVLAVSGGVDSMVLLHAVGEWLAGSVPAASLPERVTVATFDHGTGAHATSAVAHVRRSAEAHGLAVVAGRADAPLQGEAAWRDARWRFLRRLARERGATVVTAHTRDDHLETIVMRTLRGSGARGLSALLAPSPVRRPLLECSRSDVLGFAQEVGLTWVDDPSNGDRAYLRNRVRLDLLPAMREANPGFDEAMLALARRATALRTACAAAVAPLVEEVGPGRVVARGITDASWEPGARALLWQSLAEMGGIVLDWRGTTRLARFSADGRTGTRIPLSGGYEAVHRHDVIELRRRPVRAGASAALDVAAETVFGDWRFRPLAMTSLQERDERGVPDRHDAWSAWLPADGSLEVRAWRAGDRMTSSGSQPRRVKRFFADRRVAAADREGWPVVVADGEIVWIPGVRRGLAATVRSGRPRVCIICERLRS
ncbi:MAG: tRNA lysidine(34) synthetase TilS [Gemmatimonadetes bacterium]|nr:tRNA lysidine(34) synthetase TilS [Gemmatimonadota bacterium]